MRVIAISTFTRGAAIVLACLFANGVAAAAPTSRTQADSIERMTLYSVVASDQFVDNQDDRARGKGTNPFGNFASPFKTLPTIESEAGPFVGDQLMLTFDLYTTPTLETRSGSSVFVCQYNYDKNAFCDAFFDLKGGAVTAVGAFNFLATRFTLAVTGGTYGRRGATGTIVATASPTLRGATTRRTPLLTVMCRYVGCRAIEAQRLQFVVAQS
jgi:hypothetical protein